MKSKLFVNVSGDRLRVVLAKAQRARGTSLFKTIAAALLGDASYVVVDIEEVPGGAEANAVAVRFGQACSALRSRNPFAFGRPAVQVELGAHFSKVAVIDAPSLPAPALDEHVRTWMDWNWGTGASRGIARHIPMGGGKLLISLVQRDVFDAIEDCCAKLALPFTNCRPAVVAHIETLASLPRGVRLTVNVIHERLADACASTTQFLCAFDGHVQSVHMMWLPSCSEDSLTAIAQRLSAHHRRTEPVILSRIYWPADAQLGELHA